MEEQTEIKGKVGDIICIGDLRTGPMAFIKEVLASGNFIIQYVKEDSEPPFEWEPDGYTVVQNIYGNYETSN